MAALAEAARPNRPRLAVFTGELNYTVRRNIVDLDRRLDGADWLVLVHSPARTVSRLLKNQRTNLRKHGWRWLPYQAWDLWSRWATGVEPEAPDDAPGGEYTSAALAAMSRLRIRRVADIHAASAVAELREFRADLGLSLAAPILKPQVFEEPRLGTINLHKGKLPQFRGMPPAFWELWTDQAEVGCSVHRVNAKLDEGALLDQATLRCERFSTPRGLQLRLDEIGSELMCDTAVELLCGRARPIEQSAGEGRTWKKPTLAQAAQLRRKLQAREPRRTGPVRAAVKNLAALAGFAWHRWLGWRFAEPHITVLLYHRVCDDARDNLTVGVEQFERQMQLLRRHCEVMSIERVLASGRLPRSARPRVAVTFDDGYRDNATLAAPILRRHRVPCAFYVSTGMIGSDARFPHDQRRGNPPIANMGWDELRRMSACGFSVGSHTVHHIDCVAEPEETVRAELQASLADLCRELGEGGRVLAYPYGGRHQMNAQRLELVKAAGYEACLSAYGGSNPAPVDRWNVLRRGINWEFSDAAFLWNCLGRR